MLDWTEADSIASGANLSVVSRFRYLLATRMDDSASAASKKQDDDALEYRAVEPWSIFALLLGLASPLALIDPLLSLVPALGLLSAMMALARMGGDRLRPGRWMALVGLGLSAFFVMVPIARYTSANWLLARQARPVADQFLAFLRERSPEKAVLLEMVPDQRPPADDGLWTFFRNDPESQSQLRAFVERPPIRMLLALGDRADIQFYRVNGVAAGSSRALADYWYTVTFTDEQDRKKTIVLGLLLQRDPVRDESLNPWRVKDLTTEINHDRRGP